MSASAPSPETTLALILGAHAWPECPGLDEAEAFAASARRVKNYLCDPCGMGLPPEHVQDFFDDPRAPADILKDTGAFLARRQSEQEPRGRPLLDVLVYFVGHGGFVGDENAYSLFLPFTQERLLRATSLQFADLAEVLRENARHLRRYFILDACFAGAASRFVLQSSRGEMIRREIARHFPSKGVALLCSSSCQHPSKAPRGGSFTMFTGALLEVLSTNQPREAERLSLRALGQLTADLIRQRYEDAAVRPEVHSPDQRDGDLADVPLFPNPGVTRAPPQELRPVPVPVPALPPQSEKPRHELHAYPRFPMVPSHKISISIKQAYADLIPVREARGLIDQANSFRLEADPGDATVTLIKQSRLRSPEDNPPIDFWIDAFNEAGKHGPRMLAALLLSIDDAQFDEQAKQSRRELLKFLSQPSV